MVACCISMCNNMQTHGDTALVPLYLHAALPQSNTLHWAAAAAEAICPSAFTVRSCSSSDVSVCVSLHHRHQKLVYTYRILPNEDKKLSVQVTLEPLSHFDLIHCGCVHFIFFFFQMMHVHCRVRD